MSKELIEQLAKEHCHNQVDEDCFQMTLYGLEAFAKAYQAATPIDNAREALEAAANELNSALTWSFMGKVMPEKEREKSRQVLLKLRALIPSTQAPKPKD